MIALIRVFALPCVSIILHCSWKTNSHSIRRKHGQKETPRSCAVFCMHNQYNVLSVSINGYFGLTHSFSDSEGDKALLPVALMPRMHANCKVNCNQ